MQNVSNLLCPFFLDDGTPISGGRVHFVKPDCSAAPTEGSDPDYVPVYDTDGTEIENPLQLNDAGRFVIQPFVADGIDYRMIVEAPTGVPATLESESPAWRTVYIIDCKASKVTVEYSGVAVAGSLGELRQTDPSAKSVMVLGYDEAGDFCPPRVFVWKEELLDENYGTHVRSTLAGYGNKGTWELNVSKTIDVRIFGLAPSSGADCAERIGLMASGHPNEGAYFPAGTYRFSKSVKLYSVIFERGAEVVPISQGVNFVIESFFENRGGKFGTSGKTGFFAVPCLPAGSVLRTSWLDGDLVGFLTEKCLKQLSGIVFDSSYENSGNIAISGKDIFFETETELSGVTLSNCVIRDPHASGDLNVKLSGDGVTTGKTDFSGKTSALDDGELKFSTPAGGSATYGLSSMQLASPKTKTTILPESVTSDSGYFKNLEVSKTAKFEGTQTFGGTRTFEGLSQFKGTQTKFEYAYFEESQSKYLIADEANISESSIGLAKIHTARVGEGHDDDDPRTGLRLHYAKMSELDITSITSITVPNDSITTDFSLYQVLDSDVGMIFAVIDDVDRDQLKTQYQDNIYIKGVLHRQTTVDYDNNGLLADVKSSYDASRFRTTKGMIYLLLCVGHDGSSENGGFGTFHLLSEHKTSWNKEE